MKKNILGLFLEKVIDFPLWVKQGIYLRLYKDLEQYLSEDFIQLKENDVFHIYVPTLTFSGKTEIVERAGGYDSNVYNFLTSVEEGLTILEVAMNNFWTLEEVAKYYIFCLEQNYIKIPESQVILAMAGFMSGKYRTGEYFKRVGKINVDQLEETILKQKEYAESGNPKKMAEIMIELGLITEKDTHSLLVLKEEAKKRFILDATIVPKDLSSEIKDEKTYQDEIAKLNEQNKQLKDQLSKILAFLKKNG